jgi:hypothetical protein
VNQWSSWKVPEAFVRNAINSKAFFKEFSNFCKLQGLILSGGGHYLQLRAELGLQSPPAVHGFIHTGYAV